MITVFPSSVASDLSRLAITAALAESRLPVGSSARISAGSSASARATADALLLAAAQLLGTLLPLRLEAHQPEQRARPGATLRFRRAGHHHRQLEVLERRDARDQVEELEDEADAVQPVLLEAAFVHLRQILAV